MWLSLLNVIDSREILVFFSEILVVGKEPDVPDVSDEEEEAEEEEKEGEEDDVKDDTDDEV